MTKPTRTRARAHEKRLQITGLSAWVSERSIFEGLDVEKARSPEQLDKAARALLAANGGFDDIESPSGMIARRPLESDDVEYLRHARLFLFEHGFSAEFDRQAW